MLRWQLCGLPLFCRHAGLCTRFPLEVTVLVESDDDFAMKIAEVRGVPVEAELSTLTPASTLRTTLFVHLGSRKGEAERKY